MPHDELVNRRQMTTFMKFVLTVTTAIFIGWIGWVSTGVVAASQESVRSENVGKQLERMNSQLERIEDRLRKIELALAIHSVR